MNFFIDMDDVVADWHAHAQDFLGIQWDREASERIPQSDWDRLKEDLRFYRTLPVKPGAHELMTWMRERQFSTGEGVFFLTALPHDYSMPYAAQDKVWWADQHFPGVPVFFGPLSHDKWRHCQPGDVLIDDRASNCRDWISAGGQAHVYRDWESCKTWLGEIFS
jgi:hypothetical protein